MKKNSNNDENQSQNQPNNILTDCGVRDGLLIIGGKWKSMIMHTLAHHEKIRFNQMKTMIPQISQKMLTQELRELERDGLIKRKPYPEIPPRVEYSITELGLTVGHIYKSIHEWEQKYIKEIKKCREDYDEF